MTRHDKLFYALLGTVRELESVLLSLNAEKMPHDGDEFHERLNAAKRVLAEAEAEKQEPVAWVRYFQIGEDDFDAETIVGRTHPNELGMDCLAHDDWEPLFASPQQEPDRLDAERLDWLLSKLPGDAIRYCVGELSDTCNGAEFRAAIDAAKEANP